jgi:surface polysaccharide O-acyltransferase-like enzyme
MGFHKKYGLGTYLKKRALRAVIPWFLWSIILLIWKVNTNQITIEGDWFLGSLRLIFTNKVESSYWFFTTLFYCYLLIPILTYLTEHRTVLWYMIIWVFLVCSLQPVVVLWFPINQSTFGGPRDGQVIYILLGYLLNDMRLTKKQRLGIYVLGIFSLLFHFLLRYTMSCQLGEAYTAIKGYRYAHSVLYSCAVFVFLKHINWEKWVPGIMQKWLPRLASYSFGVYLIHKIVMYYLRDFTRLRISSYLWKTIYVPITYLICIAMIALLKQIPVVKKYVC